MAKYLNMQINELCLSKFGITYEQYLSLTDKQRDTLLMDLHSNWLDSNKTTRINGTYIKTRLTSSQSRDNIDKKIGSICKQKIRRRK